MSSLQAHAPKGGVSYKAMTTIFAAGVLAGVVAVLPIIMPDGESQPKQTVASTDARAPSTDGRGSAETPAPVEEAAADPCAGQTWPYIDSACADAKSQDTRQVRVISTDRAAPTTLATRTPRIEPKSTMPAARAKPEAPAAVQAAPPAPAPAQPVQQAAAPPAEPAKAAPATAAPTSVAHSEQPAPRPTTLASAPAQPAMPETVAAPVGTPTARAAAVDAVQTGPVTTPTSTRTAETARKKDKTVTVSKQAKRAKPSTQPGEVADVPREYARGRAQPVTDPGTSLGGGPTLVRTYDYADGRRVTIYQRADRGSSQAMAYGGDERPARRGFFPFGD